MKKLTIFLFFIFIMRSMGKEYNYRNILQIPFKDDTMISPFTNYSTPLETNNYAYLSTSKHRIIENIFKMIDSAKTNIFIQMYIFSDNGGIITYNKKWKNTYSLANLIAYKLIEKKIRENIDIYVIMDGYNRDKKSLHLEKRVPVICKLRDAGITVLFSNVLHLRSHTFIGTKENIEKRKSKFKLIIDEYVSKGNDLYKLIQRREEKKQLQNFPSIQLKDFEEIINLKDLPDPMLIKRKKNDYYSRLELEFIQLFTQIEDHRKFMITDNGKYSMLGSMNFWDTFDRSEDNVIFISGSINKYLLNFFKESFYNALYIARIDIDKKIQLINKMKNIKYSGIVSKRLIQKISGHDNNKKSLSLLTEYKIKEKLLKLFDSISSDSTVFIHSFVMNEPDIIDNIEKNSRRGVKFLIITESFEHSYSKGLALLYQKLLNTYLITKIDTEKPKNVFLKLYSNPKTGSGHTKTIAIYDKGNSKYYLIIGSANISPHSYDGSWRELDIYSTDAVLTKEFIAYFMKLWHNEITIFYKETKSRYSKIMIGLENLLSKIGVLW